MLQRLCDRSMGTLYNPFSWSAAYLSAAWKVLHLYVHSQTDNLTGCNWGCLFHYEELLHYLFCKIEHCIIIMCLNLNLFGYIVYFKSRNNHRIIVSVAVLLIILVCVCFALHGLFCCDLYFCERTFCTDFFCRSSHYNQVSNFKLVFQFK